MLTVYPLNLEISIKNRLTILSSRNVLSQNLLDKIAKAIQNNLDLTVTLAIQSKGLVRAHWRGEVSGNAISILGAIVINHENGIRDVMVDLDIYAGGKYLAQVEDIHFKPTESQKITLKAHLTLVHSQLRRSQ